MKIVYAYVCGDILHTAHIQALKNAKSLGDKLIVGVLTDEAVMEKKRAPALPFYERVGLIGALSFVDCVVPQDNYSPVQNLRYIQPDIHVESSSHIGNPYMKQLRKAFKGRIVMFPYFKNQSSTMIKQKIKNNL